MRKSKATLFIMSSLLLLGCQAGDLAQTPKGEEHDPIETLNSVNQCRISPDVSVLDSEDAAKVAMNFTFGQTTTKASGEEVRSVVPIYGNSGEVVLYAVNLNDGYVLVSSSKDSYPVFGYSERGEFDGKETGTGMDVLMSEYKSVREQPSSTQDCRESWRRYEWISPVATTQTRADISDDYSEIIESYLEEWYDEGYSVHYLYDKPESMPDDLYESFCQDAETEMGDMPGFPYMECAIITCKTTTMQDRLEPLLSTKWGQEAPYNNSDPQGSPLGCTTIAAGQIMHYYKFPLKYPGTVISINWSLMPDNTSNNTLSEFLLQLKNDIGVNDDGGAYISDVEKAMKSYGYSCRIISHNAKRVRDAQKAGNPVYMRGELSSGGHAWVSDGYYVYQETTEYNLYVVGYENGRPAKMTLNTQELMPGQALEYFHMNWGWGGLDDGYYIDDYIVHSASNRKDLLIDNPNEIEDDLTMRSE